MKYMIIILTLIFTFAPQSGAQWKVRSVDVGPVYSTGLSLKNTFNKVNGYGVQANLQVDINKTFGLLFSLGYSDLKVDQENAVNNWNWGFYNQSYLRLITSQLSDTTYHAVFVPKQHLYLVPISVMITGQVNPGKKLSLMLGAGGGIQIYQRHLWVHEYWSKFYPGYNYTYSYNFDNDAGDKNGTLYFLKAAFMAEYAFFKSLGITFKVSMLYHLNVFNSTAYENFPGKIILSAGFGLNFYY